MMKSPGLICRALFGRFFERAAVKIRSRPTRVGCGIVGERSECHHPSAVETACSGSHGVAKRRAGRDDRLVDLLAVLFEDVAVNQDLHCPHLSHNRCYVER